MTMFDKFGYPVQVGDTVIYAVGAQSDTSLRTGVVKSIDPNPRGVFDFTTRSWKPAVGAMIAGNQQARYSSDIISTHYFRPLVDVQAESPELFI